MSQTAYDLVPAAAFAGMLADLTNHTIETLVADESDIGFGLAVAQGDDDNTCELPDSSGDLIRGVSVHKHCETGQYETSEVVSILRQGKIWVNVDATVTKGGQVFVRHNTANGSFLAADDGANASLLANARWGSSRTGAGLVVLEIDLLGSNGSMS